MKLTIVLVALIALGLSENSGGKKDEDINDPKFKQMIEEIESFSDPNDYQIKTVESEEMKESDKEVVSGMKYYITLQVGGGSCEVDIWEQPWNNLRQVTKNTCPGGSNKRQMMAGGWGPVSDMTETGFQTALKAVLDKVNNMDNGLYRLVQSRMIDARQQVVSGMNYNITVELGASSCMKSTWRTNGLTAQDCPLDATSGLAKTIVKALVYVQSWTNTINVTIMNMRQVPESEVSVESDASESDSNSNSDSDSESSENLLGSDNTDVLSHGETNDITVDENKIDSNLDDKKPGLHKILLGQGDHDYKIHGSVVDNGKANKKPDSYRYGNMMDGFGGPEMMGDYKGDKGQYRADDMMGGYRGGNMMGDYRGGNMMDGYRGGNMMDDYRGGNMMDDYRGGDMMGGYGGYMMGGYQRRRLMGGYRRGHMMGGYRRGGMMGDNWRRGMMGGYRGGDMMRDYKDDKNVEDKFWGGHMMDPRLMGEYMSRNGMGDPEQMAEFMSKNGMGDPKQMAEFMSKNGMGDYEQMAEFMSKNGMGDPKQMAEFMSKNGMMGDYFLGGDKHDYKSHGDSSSDEESASEDSKPLIGGDKHDYLPHEGLLGGDSHDYKLHGESSSDEDGSSKDSKPLIGGGKHDYLPHGDTEVTCTKKMFEDFQTKFSKKYMAEEETAKRFAIFCENMKLVQTLQQTEKGTARYGATKFADLTEEEFKQYVGKPWNKVKKHNTEMKRADIPKGSIPTSFDWREYGAVTPVKNQGSCGSCWAFSTTGNIEGQWAIKRKQLISLSEQELVDCDKLDEGCNGGLPSNAYKEIERLGGLETETEYKYKGEDEKCEFIKKDVKVYINDSITISSNETEMAAWLAVNGPISIGINAFAMQFYMGGISHPWKIFCNPKELDHGVLIVGYGVHEGEPYWMVKNSWGPDWGEKTTYIPKQMREQTTKVVTDRKRGYYLVYRGAGVCGLNTMCTSAVVD